MPRTKSATQRKEIFRPAEDLIPDKFDFDSLKAAARECTACPLYLLNNAQTVFGEGSIKAEVVLVGEQPGDQEDKLDRPFVGPAGKLLDKTLIEAGFKREEIYITNAVKHFKFKERGDRRIHESPNRSEILACHPWLEAELQLIKPKILVCLGATAILAIFGKRVTIAQARGKFFETPMSPRTFVTVHPSSIFRHPDKAERDRARALFLKDLKKVKRAI